METLACGWCGTQFERTRTNGRPQKYCSRECKIRSGNNPPVRTYGDPSASWPRSAAIEAEVCGFSLSSLSITAIAAKYGVSRGLVERVLRRNGKEVRDLQPCGTPGAYQRHRLRGEEPCEPCRLAVNEYNGARRQPSQREVQPCGTHSRYIRHLKAGEEPCGPCSAAGAEYGRTWREANQARKQKNDRRWKAENPDRVIQSVRRRRARKLAVPSEPYTTAGIARRDGYRCGLCRRKVDMRKAWPDPMSPSIDHVVPLALGGDDTRANVQLAHFGCNSRKQARSAGQMALFG